MNTDINTHVLTAARDAWIAASPFRDRRQRYKRYTYGDQWSDILPDAGGRPVRESDLIVESGCKPLTNNMIRQIVKVVIGRYRSSCRDNRTYSRQRQDSLLELDCRMLEEFLISGCAVQRVSSSALDPDPGVASSAAPSPKVDNVNPRMFFVNAFGDPRGNDIRLIGMLHDLTLPEIINRFAGGSRSKALALARTYALASDPLSAAPPLSVLSTLSPPASIGDDSASVDFFSAPAGVCRAIEVWTLDCRNLSRRPGSCPDLGFVWHCRWFAPDATLLASYDSPFTHGSHPFALKFYPLTDGEVHSFVEDVIDQQRCINRMIVLIDHIIGSSAKGVLLFPQDQKPKNVSWDEIADVWSRSDGIIPITGTNSGLPHQVVTRSADDGAYRLLDLQMKLFDNISGVSDVIAGRDVASSTGRDVYESRLRNSAVALADLLDSFAAFRADRDRKFASL